MADKCGNCDCADKSQCVKKGSQYGIGIIETPKSYDNDAVMGVPAAEENDCKCGCGSCGTGCSCGCSCGCR